MAQAERVTKPLRATIRAPVSLKLPSRFLKANWTDRTKSDRLEAKESYYEKLKIQMSVLLLLGMFHEMFEVENAYQVMSNQFRVSTISILFFENRILEESL